MDMTKYEKIKELLYEHAEEDMLSHAYIFESSDLGKAKELSDSLCKKIFGVPDLGTVSDYHLIDKDKMKIDTVRKITKDCIVKPYKDKKIYVFSDASDFNIPMQNAFLKTLEEPPEYVIFILIIKNASMLLETVRSRCVKIFFDEDASCICEREDINLIVRKLFDILVKKDDVKIIEFMEEMKSKKDDALEIICEIMDTARNIMLAKESIQLVPDTNKQNRYIHDIVGKLGYYELLSVIEEAEYASKKLDANANYNMTVETMLFNIMEANR